MPGKAARAATKTIKGIGQPSMKQSVYTGRVMFGQEVFAFGQELFDQALQGQGVHRFGVAAIFSPGLSKPTANLDIVF